MCEPLNHIHPDTKIYIYIYMSFRYTLQDPNRFPAGRPWSCIFRYWSRFGSYNVYLNDTRISYTQLSLSFIDNECKCQILLLSGGRPEGEGPNIDRHLVPYHGKRKRIQSRIESIPSPGAKRRPRAKDPRARVLISTGI